MRGNRRIAGIAAGMMLALVGLVAMAGGAPTADRGSKGHGKMVFVLTTGLEDLQAVNMAIRHSGMALKSGYLDDSVLLVYGRAVQALSKEITAKPPQTAAFVKEASEAGVRVMACAEAMKRFGIAREDLVPGVGEGDEGLSGRQVLTTVRDCGRPEMAPEDPEGPSGPAGTPSCDGTD